jgi:hypothetical protein
LTSAETRAQLSRAGRALYDERFDVSHVVAALRRGADDGHEVASALGAGAEA